MKTPFLFTIIAILGLAAVLGSCGSRSNTSGLNIDADAAHKIAYQIAYNGVIKGFTEMETNVNTTLDKEAFLTALEVAALDPFATIDVTTMGPLVNAAANNPHNTKAIRDLSIAWGKFLAATQRMAAAVSRDFIEGFIEGAKDGVYGKPSKY